MRFYSIQSLIILASISIVNVEFSGFTMQFYVLVELFSLHNAQSKFLTVQGWDKQSSMDTEDEGDRDSWILQLPSDNQVK